ncbi:hypothetical protein NQ642_16215 [Acinetobacter baumannii]|nr:hypothetical protein [Acinetobacter baumannii]
MKVGFIGGLLDGIHNVFEFEGDQKNLPQIYKVENKEKTHWKQHELIKEGKSADGIIVEDIYILMMLKRNRTFKYFYIFSELDRPEVHNRSAENWNLSDVFGYDFD